MENKPKVVENLYINTKFYIVLKGFNYHSSIVLADYDGKYFYLKNNRVKRLQLNVSKRIDGVLNIF
jgi:nitrous oxide reductase